jgi:hypothetical protein
MTENTPILNKAQTIALAFQIAGPGATDQAIADEVTRILNATGEGSPIIYAFDSFEKRSENVEATKTVLGTLLLVDVEESSQRGVFFLKSDKAHERWNPLGKEHVRTERIDGKELGRPLLKEAGRLIGHKVALTVEVQVSDSGKNRVVTRISDRGLDENYNENAEEYQPDVSKLDTKKLRYNGSFAKLKEARAAATQGAQA